MNLYSYRFRLQCPQQKAASEMSLCFLLMVASHEPDGQNTGEGEKIVHLSLEDADLIEEFPAATQRLEAKQRKLLARAKQYAGLLLSIPAQGIPLIWDDCRRQLEQRFGSAAAVPPDLRALSPDNLPGADVYVCELAWDCVAQLQQYLQGKRQRFDLALLPIGSPFQKRAWDYLLRLDYGQQASYQEQARFCASQRHCRAVGCANRSNPIILLLPCHRVLGKNGKLVGFLAGLKYKNYFLQLERQKDMPPVCLD